MSGCSSFPDWRKYWGESAQPATRSDRFVLPPAGTDVVGAIQVTIANAEDTLLDIARHYDLGYEEITAANPNVDPWLPGDGARVVLPTQFVLPDTPREGLVLNLASMRLFYYPKPRPGLPAEVITHPVGIGREGWETPMGRSRITQKMVKPTWRVPASVRREHAANGDPLPPVVPPGPDNPLGDFAMRLSLPGYLIHGTNKPYGIGMRVSHGCVRLYPEDIARLFPEVPVGTQVHIVNQPYLAGWRDGLLYLEAHRPLAEDAKRWNGSLDPMEKAVRAKSANSRHTVNWHKARETALEVRGIPIPVSSGSPKFADMLARAPQVPSIPAWVKADEEG
jgi:L,D-transpeptidase ErfK/SrfK